MGLSDVEPEDETSPTGLLGQPIGAYRVTRRKLAKPQPRLPSSLPAEVFASLHVFLPINFASGIALIQGPSRFRPLSKKEAHGGNTTHHHGERGGPCHRSATRER